MITKMGTEYLSIGRCSTKLTIHAVVIILLIESVTGLECYSCNSFGVGDIHSDPACVDFDENELESQTCEIGDGQVGKCMKFKGSITIEIVFGLKTTGKGVFRTCEAYDKDDAPVDGCYKATDIPDDIISTIFTAASIFSVDTIDGEACYCSNDGCYEGNMAGNRARKGSNGAATMVASFSSLLTVVCGALLYRKIV